MIFPVATPEVGRFYHNTFALSCLHLRITFARRFPGLKTGRRFKWNGSARMRVPSKECEGENNSQLMMPREKMLKFGISALTDVELLALFLRTGTRVKMY